MSLSCEEIDAEIAAPELIGPFIAGGYNWGNGTVSVFSSRRTKCNRPKRSAKRWLSAGQ